MFTFDAFSGSLENSELEDTALQLFRKLDVKIDFCNTEDCHWLPSKRLKIVTVKFSKEKDEYRIRKVNKKLEGYGLIFNWY